MNLSRMCWLQPAHWGISGEGEMERKAASAPPAAPCVQPAFLRSATCLPRREQGLKPPPRWHRGTDFQNLFPHGKTTLPPLLAPTSPRGPCVPGFPPARAAGSPAGSQPHVADPRCWQGAEARGGSSRAWGNPAGGQRVPGPLCSPPAAGGCGASHTASARSPAAPVDLESRVFLSLSTRP